MINVKSLRGMLKKTPGLKIYILSLQGDHYLIQVDVGAEEQLVSSRSGDKPILFRSLVETKAALHKAGVHDCYLKHQIVSTEKLTHKEKEDGRKGDLMPVHIP